jgi:hypothetical protein
VGTESTVIDGRELPTTWLNPFTFTCPAGDGETEMIWVFRGEGPEGEGFYQVRTGERCFGLRST